MTKPAPIQKAPVPLLGIVDPLDRLTLRLARVSASAVDLFHFYLIRIIQTTVKL
jgi:hypothetical protein